MKESESWGRGRHWRLNEQEEGEGGGDVQKNEREKRLKESRAPVKTYLQFSPGSYISDKYMLFEHLIYFYFEIT